MRSLRSLIALVVLVCGTVAIAGAEAPERVGWWWRAQSGTGPAIPPPPNVPEGGLWVANDPTGEWAISALRVTAGSERIPTTLRLEVFSQQGTPTLVLCPATGTWEATEAGSWDTRPRGNCALGKRTVEVDGGAVEFDVSELHRDGVVDVVLTPFAGSGSWSVSFTPPDGDALAVRTRPVPAPERRAGPTPSAEATPEPVPALERDSDLGVPAPARAAPASTPVGDTGATETLGTGSVRATDPVPVAVGARQPIAILLLAALVATWVLRTRQAVQTASDHPLARRALRDAHPRLGADQLLDGGEEDGVGARTGEGP